MAAIPLFSLFLFVLAASFSAADDSAAMTELRTGLIPNPSGWAAQSDYCHWPGVQCDAARFVTAIDLASRSLSGSLHAVWNLTELARLRLADNRFSGRLPDFSGCTALTEVDLRGNAFTGPVVLTAMPPALKNLSLDGNYLQGALPEFRSRSVGVSFNNNSFCKTSPGNCDPQVLALLGVSEGFGFPLVLAQAWRGNNACQWELIECDHSGNVATITLINHDFRGGLISPELSQLRYLSCLTLKGNGLRGYVPERLGDLPQLKLLELAENDLFGELPAFRSDVVVVTYGNAFLRPAAAEDISPAPPRPSTGVGCWGSSMIMGMFFGIVIGVLIVVILGFIMIRILDGRVGVPV